MTYHPETDTDRLIVDLLRECGIENPDGDCVTQFEINHRWEAICDAAEGDLGALAELRFSLGLPPL